MEIGETLYVKDRAAWRAWLVKHYATEREIWLVRYTKASGKEHVPYLEALEEALCFGWIDSIVKRIDENSYAQRFTPRKEKSPISPLNKEHVRRLMGRGKMTPAGLHAIRHSFNEKDDTPKIPRDILAALKKDAEAWKHFQAFPDSYKRVRIAYIEHRRDDPEEFRRRLAHFLKMTANGKRFGFLRD